MVNLVKRYFRAKRMRFTVLEKVDFTPINRGMHQLKLKKDILPKKKRGRIFIRLHLRVLQPAFSSLPLLLLLLSLPLLLLLLPLQLLSEQVWVSRRVLPQVSAAGFAVGFAAGFAAGFCGGFRCRFLRRVSLQVSAVGFCGRFCGRFRGRFRGGFRCGICRRFRFRFTKRHNIHQKIYWQG